MYLTIALVQRRSRLGDVPGNTELGLALAREAKAGGADLVLFPEGWITGYGCPAVLRETDAEPAAQQAALAAWNAGALTVDGEEIGRFRALARELSLGLVVTGFLRGESRPSNSAFLIGRDGEIALRYDKVHTCDFDWERWLESGTGFSVCAFDGVRIGLMICYDREYPESARELMLQGAELILVPNDCDLMGPRLMELRVRALENMAGVAMANPPGPGAGCSCAFSPMAWDGDTTLCLAGEAPGLYYARFDIDALRAWRAAEDLGRYRKPAAYRHLLDGAGR